MTSTDQVIYPEYRFSPQTLKYLRRDAETLIMNLHPLPAFRQTQNYVHRRIAGHLATRHAAIALGTFAKKWGMDPVALEPVPLGYLTRIEAAVLAQASATPGQAHALSGLDGTKQPALLKLSPDFEPLASEIFEHANQLAAMAGYVPPAFLHCFWTAFALIAPHGTAEQLLEVMPLLAPLTYDRSTGSINLDADPERPSSASLDLLNMQSSLAKRHTRRPERDFIPQGRPKRWETRADLLRDVDDVISTLLIEHPRTRISVSSIVRYLDVNRDTLSDALREHGIDLKARLKAAESRLRKNAEKLRR